MLSRASLRGTFFVAACAAAAVTSAGTTQAQEAQGPATAQAPATPQAPATAQAPATPASTQAPATPAPAVTPVPPGPSGTSPKRVLPDYDGRGEPPTRAGDVALWIPRVVLAPAYLVSEYVIRRPLGWFIATAERNQWPSAIVNLFTFGPDKKAGVVPTALIDFGFKPSVGLYAFWDDLLGEGNHLRLHASTWGPDWLQGSLADRFPVGKGATFDLRVEGTRRPDQIFHGLGPRSLESDRARYGIDRIQARPVFETTWWKGSRLTVEGGVKHVEIRDATCCDDPSLFERARAGTFAAPPGVGGYTAVYQRGELTVDSREPRPESQTGVRVELEGEQGANARRAGDSWIRYGGSVGGFLDVKNNRTVSLSVTALFVDPLAQGATIPFTEQVLLGGSGPMRGYLLGRLVDRSAAVATLKYRWPIWIFLDGTMQASLGNVFGPQLEDFKTKLLRVSGAVGVESIGGADHTFELLAGFGTETFDQGASVSSFRLVFGTNRGF